MGGTLASGAAVASWGDGGECELFAIHDDGELRDRYWDGARWHDWESLGAGFAGQPAAAARDADRIDVLAFGTDAYTLTAEASGRQAVKLTAPGQFQSAFGHFDRDTVEHRDSE